MRKNINMNPTLKIMRDKGFEKAVLRGPSKVVQRRKTTAVRTAQPEPARLNARRLTANPNAANPAENNVAQQSRTLSQKNIPFGARGRKRQTWSRLDEYCINLRPNLDGVSGVSAQQRQQRQPAQQPTPQPAQVIPPLSPIRSPVSLYYSGESDF